MEVKRLYKHFDSPAGALEVFRDFSLKLPDKKISVILGPSGCGKTTLLNIAAGFIPPDAGGIKQVPRRLSYLFQEPRLLPWRTVARNISIVIERHIPDKQKRSEAVSRYLELVGLDSFGGHYPHELSGGMRQRASIARAFACPSEMLLMDEPFQALDLDLRLSLVGTFTRLWEEEPKTTVFVTHDIQEALMIADVITVLSRRPAQVLDSFTVDIPRSERSLDDPALTSVEQQVVSLLLKRE